MSETRSNDITIQPASLRDVRQISGLSKQSVATAYSFYNDEIKGILRGRQSIPRLFNTILRGLRVVLVAKRGRQVVGYLVGTPANDGVALVYSLYVDKDERGSAVGKRLLDYFDDQVVPDYIAKIMLWTEVAAPYYRKIGWREAAELPDHWWGQTFWIFVKDRPARSHNES